MHAGLQKVGSQLIRREVTTVYTFICFAQKYCAPLWGLGVSALPLSCQHFLLRRKVRVSFFSPVAPFFARFVAVFAVICKTAFTAGILHKVFSSQGLFCFAVSAEPKAVSVFHVATHLSLRQRPPHFWRVLVVSQVPFQKSIISV